MSNLVCPVCGSSNIQTERRPDGFHHCMECRYSWAIGASQQKQTVFDHITANEEVLAEKLVYYLPEIDKYTSEIIAVFYKDRAEAFAATVAELKKEWKFGKDNNAPVNPTDNNVGSMEVTNG